jgi:heme-degrading monooxygenase HmoA
MAETSWTVNGGAATMARLGNEHLVLWAYRIRPGMAKEFERMYGPNGDWARLFSGWEGYLGTELWHDRRDRRRYVTVDRWRSGEDYERFRTGARDRYLELDAHGARLTESEGQLATLERVHPEGVSSPRRSDLSPAVMRRGWRADTLAGENS